MKYCRDKPGELIIIFQCQEHFFHGIFRISASLQLNNLFLVSLLYLSLSLYVSMVPKNRISSIVSCSLSFILMIEIQYKIKKIHNIICLIFSHCISPKSCKPYCDTSSLLLKSTPFLLILLFRSVSRGLVSNQSLT